MFILVTSDEQPGTIANNTALNIFVHCSDAHMYAFLVVIYLKVTLLGL